MEISDFNSGYDIFAVLFLKQEQKASRSDTHTSRGGHHTSMTGLRTPPPSPATPSADPTTAHIDPASVPNRVKGGGFSAALRDSVVVCIAMALPPGQTVLSRGVTSALAKDGGLPNLLRYLVARGRGAATRWMRTRSHEQEGGWPDADAHSDEQGEDPCEQPATTLPHSAVADNRAGRWWPQHRDEHNSPLARDGVIHHTGNDTPWKLNAAGTVGGTSSA